MIILTTVIFFGLLLFPPSTASSGIIVHDLITVKGQQTMLKVETRGKLLSKGGELVDISVNGKQIGRALSGGDGFAFRQFMAAGTGIYRITAKSGKEEGRGVLLSLTKGQKIIFIDAEGVLLKEAFSEKTRKGSRETIKKLSGRFPVVFLQTGLLGVKALKTWLKENGFQEAPVIPWRQGMIFEEIKEMGLKIKAVIGSRSVVESAKPYNARAFSFEAGGDAEEVKEWDDIRKKINQ